MIVIKAIPVTKIQQHVADFQSSLANNSADKESYTLISQGDAIPFSASVVISLPNDCLVLNNSWDRYISFNLDNKKPIDVDYVKRRLGLVDRKHNGIFPEVSITYPSIFRKLLSRIV